MRELSRGQEAAVTAGLIGLSLAGIAFWAAPEESRDFASEVAAEAGFGDADTVPDGTSSVPTTEAEPEPVASGCIDIGTVDIDARIGAVLIPMAEVTQLDTLRGVMRELKISNFAIKTEDAKLSDTATLGGSTWPTAGENGVFQALKTDVTTATQVRTTMFLDEEGGIVQRTQTIPGFDHLPSALQQSLMSPDQLKAIWTTHVQRLHAMGLDVAFGPVADIGAPDSSITELERSYGANVVTHGGVVIDTLHENGVGTVLKHLYYGTVVDDTHESPGYTAPFSELTPEINAVQQLIANNAPDAIMVSHATIPGLSGPLDSKENGQQFPASLSAAVYDHIEGDLRFTGVKMTDALDMDALRISMNPANPPDELTAQMQGAWQALAAGADMAILTVDAAGPAHQEIKDAISDGRLDESRLNDAAATVFEVMKDYDICGFDNE